MNGACFGEDQSDTGWRRSSLSGWGYSSGVPAEGEALFLRKGLSVVGDMLTNKGGDKVITVVITFLHSELQVNAFIVTGFLQRFGL